MKVEKGDWELHKAVGVEGKKAEKESVKEEEGEKEDEVAGNQSVRLVEVY